MLKSDVFLKYIIVPKGCKNKLVFKQLLLNGFIKTTDH